MAEKVLMLALSPTMTDGTITEWKFKEGDAVSSGSVLCEVETDKAVMDYESSVSGSLLKIVVGPGGVAAVGDLIAVVGAPGEDIAGILASATKAAAQPGPAAASVAAAASPGPRTAPLAEAPRPVPPVPAPEAPAESSFPRGRGAAPTLAPGVPPSSPLARSVARKSGLDIRGIAGSGPGGRVVLRDVEAALSAPLASRQSAAPASGGAASPLARPGLEDRSVPVSRMRATIARRLSESMREAPHFFLRVAVDAGRLMELRRSLNQGRPEEGNLSLNTLFAKLSAEAIALHPVVNAAWKGDVIEYRRSVDMGLAVAVNEGLVVPVVRDCAVKGLSEIEAEFRLLIAKAKDGSLQPSDYENASFTISNLGAWGIEEFTAVINPPASAILALGAIVKEPVVGPDGAISVRPTLRATLSCDHRVIDGAAGAAFLKDLKDILEEPARALL